MNRLLPIEGLRAYLALWVVIGHVVFFSIGNFHDRPETGIGTQLGRLVGDDGPLAVNIFMIISGFVIFFLLDKRKESYRQFILRRFFRLYPLYLVILLAALALGPLTWWTFQHAEPYMTQASIAYYSEIHQQTSDNWFWNLVLHLGMFQGATPSAWLGRTSAYSFIIAAWSISVEWEFYLIAPLLYFLLVVTRPVYRIITLIAAGLVFIFIGHSYRFEAFLPVFLPFFFIGIASYFIYKQFHSAPPDTAFPLTLGFALVMFSLGGKSEGLITLVVWIPFLGLLCEDQASISSRIFLHLFNNPVAQYLGGISYGIYLCHELIITGVQYLLITVAPEHDRVVHFWLLLSFTILGTIALAALLHWLVEVPGMELGRKLASRIKAKPVGAG